MDDQKMMGECNMQLAMNSSAAEPGIVLPRHAANEAVKLAERSVDDINALLRDAERQRDELARKLGAQQDMVDRLLGEREYRSRHVRELLAARDH